VRWVVVLIALAGCGQLLGFEEGVVATVGHDEDMDGIDDGLDNCPADVNQTQSATEPGIGRVCDPRPEQEGDQIAMFFSFYPMGAPDALESDEVGVTYTTDMVMIDDTSIRTRETFAPSTIAASMTFGTFVGTEAYVELSVGDRACRIAPCSSRICVVVADGATTSSKEFTPTSFGVTLALVQTETLLACVLPLQDAVVSLATTGSTRDSVRVRVEQASMFVQNLVVYDIP
jgi:hypothetical protein